MEERKNNDLSETLQDGTESGKNIENLGVTTTEVVLPLQQRKNRKLKPISNDLRDLVVKHSLSGLNNTEIGKLLTIPRTSVGFIVKKFNETGDAKLCKKGGDNRSILKNETINFINSEIDEDPTLTLADLANKVLQNFNVIASVSTIHRCILGFHYTLKNLVMVPAPRNCLRTIEKRYAYAQDFNRKLLEVDDKNFIFVDEVGYSVVSRTRKGRSLIGTSPYVSTVAVKSRNISVIAAMNKCGMVFYKINNGPVNGENFKQFLIDLKITCTLIGIQNPTFVMDNAKIHHYRGLDILVTNSNYNFFYLPPYSPFLNPIENVFSKWKNFVIRGNSQNEAELGDLINAGFLQITSDDCDGYYRKMLRYIRRSLDSEEIFE